MHLDRVVRRGFASRLRALVRPRTVDPREVFATLAGLATAIRQRTEPEFLKLASDLQALHQGAAELSRTTRQRVTSVRDTLSQNRLTGSGGLADRALEELRSGLAEAEGRLRMLSHTCDAMRRLRGQGTQMQRVASRLEISGYGFAVESARSQASREAFHAFVDELRKLAAKVGAVGEAISDQATSARDESERLRLAMTASLAELYQLTEQAGGTVRATSARVESILAETLGALQDVERDTSRIAAHASEAVYHLQFGDIVRQKLEHVAEALGAASAGHADELLAVQAGQLELVAEEILSARRQLDHAFAGLAEESSRLAGTIGSLGGKPGNHGLAELRDAFRNIEELELRGRALCSSARETSARAAETTGKLSQHLSDVDDINHQMRLQALNAIIKTALLGDEGRTIEVLSMHVQRVFEESNTLVAETVGLISGLSAEENTSLTRASASEDTAAALKLDLGQLGAVEEECGRAMQAAAEHSEMQELALARSRVSLEFLSSLGEEVEALRRETDKARANASPQSGSTGERLKGARYTMASEREVHQRLIQPDAPPQPQDGPQPEVAAPEHDLGDNVDLF